MTDTHRPRQRSLDRARRRAIRVRAAQAGIPYSVAARQIGAAVTGIPASRGRTIYPEGTDTHRRQLIALRGRRSPAERVEETRRAAELPMGRARHLADRFPPTRGEPGSGVGPLYYGEARQDGLALLYSVIMLESPHLVPTVGDLAWAAELGEETALDTECGDLDRAARLLLDLDPAALGRRVAAALTAEPAAEPVRVDLRIYEQSARRAAHRGPPVLDGVGHILDAVLVVADDGHAPGTRVRMLTDSYQGRAATIVSAVWDKTGPPLAYRVLPDAGSDTATQAVLADPQDLTVLSGCMTSGNAAPSHVIYTA